MKIAIIGGSGKMGRWLARYLLKEGKEVVITGRNPEKLKEAGIELGVPTASNAEAVKQAEVVVLSVPIESLEGVVKELAPHTRPGQSIIEITSAKTVPLELLHRHIKAGTVLGVHPMFGPGAKGIQGQNFVLTPTSEKESALAQKVAGYLTSRGARVKLMTPAEHDEVMSVVLGLAHFIAIVSADTLLSFEHLKEMGEVSGSTYKLLLTLVEGVLAQEPELYGSLQMSFPRMAEKEKLFLEKARNWAELVACRDREDFNEKLCALKQGLESKLDLEQAYRNIYKMLEGLDV